MAHTFAIEVYEDYRILVVTQAIDWGWQYYPQEKKNGKWWWMNYGDGSTVCFRSREACDRFLEIDQRCREA